MSNATSPAYQPLPHPPVGPDVASIANAASVDAASVDAKPLDDLAVFVETIRRKAIAEFVATVQPLIEQAAVEWDVRADVHWQGGKRDLAARGHGRASGLRMAGGILVEVAVGKEK